MTIEVNETLLQIWFAGGFKKIRRVA